MRPPDDGMLAAAPELAVADLAARAVRLLAAVLRVEHPTLDHDFTIGDPPSLIAARDVARHARRLAAALRRYRAAVRSAVRGDDDLPF